MIFFFHILLAICFTAPSCNGTALFDAYPGLRDKIPHVSLCSLPTPITKLDGLCKATGFKNLYVKNDALTADNFGGNKVRKLEFLLADAQAKKATRVIARGFAGSNFCCATAVHTKQLGIPCDCLYMPQLNTTYLQRNALIAGATGANLHLFANKEEALKAFHAIAITDPQAYLIPGGGSNAVGALGFVNAAFELKSQITANAIPCPDEIFITYGSAGSAAGLALGLKAAGLACHLMVVQVDKPNTSSVFNDIQLLFNATNDLLCANDATFKRYELATKDIAIVSNHFDGTYAKIATSDAQAIKLLATTDGIKTDGTYAGKTIAAMLDYLNALPDKSKSILFWNTFFSGREDVLKHAQHYKTLLPAPWHRYFDGTLPLQPEDQGV